MNKQMPLTKTHNPFKTGMIRLRSMLQAMLLSAAILGVSTAQADVAQAPLLTSADNPPNILFVLDDSGSMHWEYIPDSLGDDYDRFPYVYPQPRRVYGPTDFTYVHPDCWVWTGSGWVWTGERRYYVPTFHADNWHNVQFRSHATNPQYYNPDITYQPWVDAQGNTMDDADPETALYNPFKPEDIGGKNLLQEQTEQAFWFRGDSAAEVNDYNFDCQGGSHSYWPITYYIHDGGDTDDIDNFTRVQITSNTPAGTTFTSPNGTERTLAEEVQNFANWFQYHRSRVLSARGGIGRAFAAQGSNIRVGYGSINTTGETVDGIAGNTVLAGVRRFEGDRRDNFFDLLYEQDISGGTPLRRALQGAGEYFSRDDDHSAWSTTPGEPGGQLLSCRQNSTVLMTDGFWNGPAPEGIGNADGTDGDLITGEDGQQFEYESGAPFEDNFSDTLADVAMYYWKNDLQEDMDNNVPTTPRNPAFWQHMVTYGVGLGVEGSIDPDTAFGAISSGDTVSWPNPHTGGDAAKIDDLLHAAVNSRGGFFSAMDPDVFSEELASILSALVDETTSSTAAIAANSAQLETDSVIFQAQFDTTDWSGNLRAFRIEDDGSVVTEPLWNADSDWFIPGSNSLVNRTITTWNPNDGGTNFRWNNLNADQRAALDFDGRGEDRLAWLRGDDIHEGGLFRARETVLGTIVNSAPAADVAQNFGLANLPADAGGNSYADYHADKQARTDVVYVGANDGMLHALNAMTGEPLFSYVPNAVYPNLGNLSDPNYTHRFYVDGAPTIHDAFIPPPGGIQPEWRTVLVGSTGAGGESVFALDITEPENFGPGHVLWEFTDEDMHYSTSQASVIRLNNGDWAAVFGNGYGEGAHLYVVELASGDLIEKIELIEDGENGLASPAPIATDLGRISDIAYAGDLDGNLWRIDLSSNNSNQWGSSFSQGNNELPMFEARGPNGEIQPITTRPAVTLDPEGGFVVLFGTGAFFRDSDTHIPPLPGDRDIQTFYGLKDSVTAGTRIAGPSGTGGERYQPDGLVRQEILAEGDLGDFGFDLRVTTQREAGAHGWYLDLLSPVEGPQTERVVARALVRGNRVVFTTLIPNDDPCGLGGESWLMEMNAFSGARLQVTPFDLDGDGNFTEDDFVEVEIDGETIRVPVSGKRTDGVISTPAVVTDGDREYKYTTGPDGVPQRTVESRDQGTFLDSGRQSWQQLR